MSQENVEIVSRGYAAFVEQVDRDGLKGSPPQGFLAWLDPDIEWRGPRQFPDLAEPRFGHAGVREYMTVLAEALDDYRMVPEEFIDAGENRVLVFSREGGRGVGSGAEVMTQPTAHLWTLRDGKAVRMESYWERADALEAAGLSG
jgi:uncharacterized protein